MISVPVTALVSDVVAVFEMREYMSSYSSGSNYLLLDSRSILVRVYCIATDTASLYPELTSE